jgi:acyl-CoA thioester hydrolase
MERKIPERFRWPLTIGEGDIDDIGHVNNVVYVRWIQETASAHWMSLADETLRKGMAWVVLRHEIDYRSAAMPQDEPYALTHVGETDGLRSIRHVDIHNKDGRLLASARTTWCLLDSVSRKPRRIPDVVRRVLLGENT